MPTKAAETNKPKPEHVRDGPLSITIWKNTSAKGFPYDTFSPQRSYRDAKGEWQNTTTFRKRDLLPLAELFKEAYKHAPEEKGEEDASE